MKITIYLRIDDNGRFRTLAEVPGGSFKEAITFQYESEHNPLAVCERMFRTFNSYPFTKDMPAAVANDPDVIGKDHPLYDRVVEYRGGFHRSLSVGDQVVIDGTHYEVQMAGFARLKLTPQPDPAVEVEWAPFSDVLDMLDEGPSA